MKSVAEVLLGATEGPGRTLPCQACATPVEISASTWELAKDFSRVLIARGEPPMGEREIARCASCHEVWKRITREKADHLNERLKALLREVATTGKISREADEWLREKGYWSELAACEALIRKNLEARGRRRSDR